MRCEYLNYYFPIHGTKWFVTSCKALNNLYLPSLDELVSCCKNSDHKKCSIFLKSLSDNSSQQLLFENLPAS